MMITTRLGEALAIILRFVSSDWKIEQRLVRVQMLSKSLSGEEIARELISVPSVSFSIGSSDLLASMRDTIDHVGERFECPTLDEFITHWISLFSHSPKCKMLWRSRICLATARQGGGAGGKS